MASEISRDVLLLSVSTAASSEVTSTVDCFAGQGKGRVQTPYLVGFQLQVALHPCLESGLLNLNGIDRTGQRRDAEVTVI